MSCAVLRVRHIQPVTRLPILVARCFSSSFSPSSPSSPSLPSSKPPASISATRSTSSAPLSSSEATEVFPEEEIVPERLISSALSVDPLLAVSSSTDEAVVDRSIQSSHAPVQSGDSSVTFAPTSSISASEYLFHLAEEEEGQAPPSPRPTRATLTQMEDAPWTGDEPIEATIRASIHANSLESQLMISFCTKRSDAGALLLWSRPSHSQSDAHGSLLGGQISAPTFGHDQVSR